LRLAPPRGPTGDLSMATAGGLTSRQSAKPSGNPRARSATASAWRQATRHCPQREAGTMTDSGLPTGTASSPPGPTPSGCPTQTPNRSPGQPPRVPHPVTILVARLQRQAQHRHHPRHHAPVPALAALSRDVGASSASACSGWTGSTAHAMPRGRSFSAPPNPPTAYAAPYSCQIVAA
jgi:hypothetical protein